MKIARTLLVLSSAVAGTAALAQVPDLLSSFDAGGRAFGAGGAMNGTNADTVSASYNPAALGYVSQPTSGAALRTLPNSFTTVTGPLNDLRFDSVERSGDLHLTHVGYARPLGGGATLGVTYTLSGYMHDEQRGNNLPGGIQRYLDAVRINTDMLQIGYGRASSDQSMSFGIGLLVAMNTVFNRQRVEFTDPNIPTTDTRSEDSAFGIGLQAGLIFTPRGNPNVTFAISGRTPIEIQDAQDAGELYDKIPGRFAASAAVRQDGYRGGRDYIVYGAEIEHFFGARGSERVPRDSVTAAHVGAEYFYTKESFTVPVRIGYSVVPAGSGTFSDRNVLTYGFGYRPLGQNWAIDVAFGNADTGARDTAISFGIRF